MKTISAEQFNGKYGDSATSSFQAPKQSFLQDAGSDISQIGTDIKASVKKQVDFQSQAMDRAVAGKQGALETTAQDIGSGLGMGSAIFGDIFKGVVKAVLPQSWENGIKSGMTAVVSPIMETQIAKSVLQKYNSLDPRTKANVDAGLGLGQFALDVATLGVGKKAEEVAIEQGGKLATKVGEIAGETASDISTSTGRILKGVGEASYGITTTPQETTARALSAYNAKYPSLMARVKGMITGTELPGKPITEANTAARSGLAGTEKEIGVQSARIQTELWNNKIAPALDNGVKVNMQTLFNDAEKEIRKIPELATRNSRLEALQSLREDYKNVSNVSLSKLQGYKEGWAAPVPEKYYNNKNIAGAYNNVKAVLADKARQTIYDKAGTDDIRQAYIDYNNLKSIKEAGIKSSTGDLAKKSLGRGIWQFVMDKAITPISTFGGKVLYKTGEGLEFIGKPGAKKVGDIIK